jgi:SAM-dependent methyltransferase
MSPESPERSRFSGPEIGGPSFDEFYYRNCCGKPYLRNDEWLAFFGGFADRIVSDIGPKKVLDAGCALGLLVEALRTRGVDAQGIDISSYAIDHVYEPIKPYCRLGSVVGDLGGRYDLIVAIELVEHMPPRDAEAAIENFCACTDDILFSSSPLDYREPTHVNVHPPEHWAEVFARHGFYRDVEYDATYVTPWAARVRRGREPLHRLVRDYEHRFWELAFERNEVRDYSAEVQTRLAGAERERDESRARVAAFELDLQREKLAKSTEELEHATAERDELAVKLSRALHTIGNMERSLFWKLRVVTMRIRSLFR